MKLTPPTSNMDSNMKTLSQFVLLEVSSIADLKKEIENLRKELAQKTANEIKWNNESRRKDRVINDLLRREFARIMATSFSDSQQDKTAKRN